MSTRRGPVRVVQQFALGGGIDVVELHGLGKSTCMNVLRDLTPSAAGRVVRDAQRFYEAEFVSAQAEGDLERPCPHCGRVGEDLEDVFGFRFITGGRRIRQSWCRECRRGGRSSAAASARG